MWYSDVFANNSPVNELTLPNFYDSSNQIVLHFLRDLDEYYKIKKVPEDLKLPLAMRAVTDPIVVQRAIISGNIKTGSDYMQVAASLGSKRATANYSKHHLRSGIVKEVNLVQRSEFEDNDERYLVGERARGNDDNCMMHDSEQVTQGRLNRGCPSDVTNGDGESNKRGEKLMCCRQRLKLLRLCY